MHRADARTKTRARLAVLAAFILILAVPGLGQTAQPASLAPSGRVVLVSIPDRKLAVLDGGEVIATFPIAVGAAASPSPTGEFKIVSRVSHPTYYHAGKAIPPGRDNPLGTRWLGLSQKGYGIHGTNAPRSVGHAASHGCFRLRNRDMERLFTMVRAGDTILVRAERDEQIAQVFATTPLASDAEDARVSAARVLAQAGGQ
jgi:L,D-transpeptidase catalytic domain